MEKFLICIQNEATDAVAKANRHGSLADAVAFATKMLQDNSKYKSIAICEAKHVVERAAPPIVITEL